MRKVTSPLGPMSLEYRTCALTINEDLIKQHASHQVPNDGSIQLYPNTLLSGCFLIINMLKGTHTISKQIEIRPGTKEL